MTDVEAAGPCYLRGGRKARSRGAEGSGRRERVVGRGGGGEGRGTGQGHAGLRGAAGRAARGARRQACGRSVDSGGRPLSESIGHGRRWKRQ